MPTIWRFLTAQYLKVLGLSLVAFVAVLLTTRLDEIAQFAALGAVSGQLWRFILYQIPYVLPIAIPISALISALLLFQRLSSNYELTALRSCGYSLAHICAPLLLVSASLAIANFYLISETATHSHLMKRVLRRELKSINPLILLQNDKLLRLKGLYVEAEGGVRSTEHVNKLIVANYNTRTDTIDLLLADKLSSTPEALSGTHVSIVTTLEGESDKLYIENADHMESPTRDLSYLLGKGSWKPKDDHLSLSLLLHRNDSLRRELENADLSKSEHRKLQRQWNSSISEIGRRISVALAVITFTLLGLAYGIAVHRDHVQRGILTVVLLAALFLVCFFTAKALHNSLYGSLALYFVPHIILVAASMRRLVQVNKGTVA